MTIRNGGHFIINSEYIMISEYNIKKRISVLDTDIQKVSLQIQELDKQKQDAVALMNALNGAKQQCISFLKDLNDDEPDEDPEVRKTRDFFGEVNKKIGEVNNKAKFIAWCNTDHVKNGVAHMRQHNPDLAKMAVDRIQLKMKQLKGEA